MTKTVLSGALILVASFIGGQVLAAEETLNFRFVTNDIDMKGFAAPYSDEMNVSVGKSAGVAVFEDGRLAFKEYVYNTSGGGEGKFVGYSTYTFENGDQLNLSFSGGWGADGSGGDYVIESGTGAFEGVTGTGRFDAVKGPWENADLYEGSFTIQSGGN